LHFIEHSYAGDPTNWWVPNRACVEAMLRSAGFDIVERAEEEVFVCRRRALELGPDGRHAVYPARGDEACSKR
jgi:tRNA (mo5U34)-methyltransferase